MRGSQKSKGITWASDEYLCQVRLFLSEESPSQVASNAQDHLQAKTPWEHVPNGSASDENLPPGFEGTQSAPAWMINLSQIPLIKWKCPPKFVVDGSWSVVAGEESEEVKTQSKREMSILEAIYPRNIPSDPEFAAAEAFSHHDQQQCPLIPITSVEDEDVVAPEIQNDSAPLNAIPMAPQQTPSAATPSLDPNFLAAAQSALTMLMKNNNNQANMIDSDLLLKVLSDPSLIEQLGRNPGPFTQPAAMNLHIPHVSRPELAAPPVGGFYSPLPSASAPSPPLPPPPIAPVTKDVNYYKSLIQQHGEERPDSSSSNSGGIHSNNNNSQQFAAVTSGFRQRDSKQKSMKPCMYFNTSRGCRNGANCAFQHDALPQQRINGNNNPSKQNANKRMKLEREITGT